MQPEHTNHPASSQMVPGKISRAVFWCQLSRIERLRGLSVEHGFSAILFYLEVENAEIFRYVGGKKKIYNWSFGPVKTTHLLLWVHPRWVHPVRHAGILLTVAIMSETHQRKDKKLIFFSIAVFIFNCWDASTWKLMPTSAVTGIYLGSTCCLRCWKVPCCSGYQEAPCCRPSPWRGPVWGADKTHILITKQDGLGVGAIEELQVSQVVNLPPVVAWSVGILRSAHA